MEVPWINSRAGPLKRESRRLSPPGVGAVKAPGLHIMLLQEVNDIKYTDNDIDKHFYFFPSASPPFWGGPAI